MSRQTYWNKTKLFLKILDLSMPDFAAEAVGGMILATPGTETYHKPKSSQLTLFGFPIWKPDYYSPRKIIQVFESKHNYSNWLIWIVLCHTLQPWSQPGECWAFSGSRGKVEIELAHVAQITQVTLEHIPTSAALTGVIDTAPKHFNVFVRDIFVSRNFVYIPFSTNF